MEKWSPTAEYLTARIPDRTFEIVPLYYEHVLSSVENGNVDFILANPSLYIEFESLYGANFIATLKNLREGYVYTQYGGVVFCRTDRNNINGFKFPYRDEHGNIIGLIVFVIDITERKKAEETLKKSEEVLSKFINSAKDAYHIFD